MTSSRKPPQFRASGQRQGPVAGGNAEEIAFRLDAIAQRWMLDARIALADLSEPLGALMQGTAQEPTAMVLVKENGKVVRSSVEQGGQSDSVDNLKAGEILQLSARPLRGKELAQVTERMNAASQDNSLGEALYSDLVAVLARHQTSHDYGGQTDAIARFDRDAAVRGGIVGRIIKQSAADGYAQYMVTHVSGDRARVQHLDAVDGYSVPQWGADAWIDRFMAEKNIQQQDAMRRLFSKPR